MIFQEDAVIRQLADQLSSRPATFQLLFRVGDIRHDPVVGSHARAIELVEDAILLPDNDQVWRTAARIMEGNAE